MEHTDPQLEGCSFDVIPLMEEILHHLECINLVNNGINYLSTGEGFLPSTYVLGKTTSYFTGKATSRLR